MDFEDILANFECYSAKSYTGSSNWTAKKYEILFHPVVQQNNKGLYPLLPICVRNNNIPAYVKNDENVKKHVYDNFLSTLINFPRVYDQITYFEVFLVNQQRSAPHIFF